MSTFCAYNKWCKTVKLHSRSEKFIRYRHLPYLWVFWQTAGSSIGQHKYSMMSYVQTWAGQVILPLPTICQTVRDCGSWRYRMHRHTGWNITHHEGWSMALVAAAVNDTDFSVSFFLPFKVKLAKLIGWVWHASTPPPRGIYIGPNVCCSTKYTEKRLLLLALSGNKCSFLVCTKSLILVLTIHVPDCSIPTCPFIPILLKIKRFQNDVLNFGVWFKVGYNRK